MTSLSSENLVLHRMIYEGLPFGKEEIEENKSNINLKDCYGNTALHIACMLGRKDAIKILLENGATVHSKNNEGWTPLAEAISYGSRSTISHILSYLKREAFSPSTQNNVRDMLKSIPDFDMSFRWKVGTWIPFLSSYLPSDECRLTKKDAKLRLNTSIVNFSDHKWVKGDLSIILDLEKPFSEGSYFVNHKERAFQPLSSMINSRMSKNDQETDIVMASEIVTMKFDVEELNLKQESDSWFSDKVQKTASIGGRLAKFYRVKNVYLKTKKRFEHLSEEDMDRNRSLKSAFKRGNIKLEDPNKIQPERRSSVPLTEQEKTPLPPWPEYVEGNLSPVETYLGRKPDIREDLKSFTFTMAMCEDIPLTIDHLISLLRILSPFKRYEKLQDVLKQRLPKGFPMKLDVPMHTVLNVEFEVESLKFSKLDSADRSSLSSLDDSYKCDIVDEYFCVPESYEERQFV